MRERLPFAPPHLHILFAEIVEVRDGLLRDGHHPEIGDDNWTFGCTAYQRQIHAVRRLAATHDWLKELPSMRSLEFLISIDGIPLKIIREPQRDRVSAKHRLVRTGEAKQQQGVLFTEFDCYRLVIRDTPSSTTRVLSVVGVHPGGEAEALYSELFPDSLGTAEEWTPQEVQPQLRDEVDEGGHAAGQ